MIFILNAVDSDDDLTHLVLRVGWAGALFPDSRTHKADLPAGKCKRCVAAQAAEKSDREIAHEDGETSSRP
jgi:hypothetical protein